MFLKATDVAYLVPKFDGKSPSDVIHFVKKAKLAQGKVAPNDRVNLTALIRNKISGEADQLLSETLDVNFVEELVDLVTEAYSDFFDLQKIQRGLINSYQAKNEKVKFFGMRITEHLNLAREAAKLRFKDPQLDAYILILKEFAHNAFIDVFDPKIMSAVHLHKPESLVEAIKIAKEVEMSFDKSNSKRANEQTSSQTLPPSQ